MTVCRCEKGDRPDDTPWHRPLGQVCAGTQCRWAIFTYWKFFWWTTSVWDEIASHRTLATTCLLFLTFGTLSEREHSKFVCQSAQAAVHLRLFKAAALAE